METKKYTEEFLNSLSELYVNKQLAILLNVKERAIRHYKKIYNIKGVLYKKEKYTNLADFLCIKYKGYCFAQSLNEDTPNIYYGFKEQEEITVDINKVFNLKQLWQK